MSPFFVLSRLVSEVVSDFWEGGCGGVLCTLVRADGSGQSVAARGEESLQDWHPLLCTRCKDKGEKESFMRRKGRNTMIVLIAIMRKWPLMTYSSAPIRISRYRGGRNSITLSLQIHMLLSKNFCWKIILILTNMNKFELFPNQSKTSSEIETPLPP